MGSEEEATPPLPSKKWLLLITIETIIVFAVVGLLIKYFAESYGLGVVSENVHAFAQQMRIVRPLLLLVLYSFWQPSLRVVSRMRLLTATGAARLVRNRNRFFLWVALLEITLGQGQVVIGVSILVGVLVYARLMNALKGEPSP